MSVSPDKGVPINYSLQGHSPPNLGCADNSYKTLFSKVDFCCQKISKNRSKQACDKRQYGHSPYELWDLMQIFCVFFGKKSQSAPNISLQSPTKIQPMFECLDIKCVYPFSTSEFPSLWKSCSNVLTLSRPSEKAIVFNICIYIWTLTVVKNGCNKKKFFLPPIFIEV